MAHYRYLFGHYQDAMVEVEIPMFGVYITDRLNAVGYMQASFQLDQTGKDNQVLIDSTTPGKCFIVVMRDDKAVWGGFITSRTYQAQSKSFQIYAKTFEGYIDLRLMPVALVTDGSVLPSSSQHVASDLDQAYLFFSLMYFFLRNNGENNYGVDAGPLFPLYLEPFLGATDLEVSAWLTSATGVTKSFSVARYEYKTVRQVMDELANADDGFDWKIVPKLVVGYESTDPDEDFTGPVTAIQVHKFLQFGYPYFGYGMSHDGIIFEYPGSILNYYRTDNLAGTGTTTVGMGAGSGESMLIKEVGRPDLVTADGGFYPIDVTVPLKHITEQSNLNSRTMQEASKRKPPKYQYAVNIRPDIGPDFNTYELGSPVTLKITDALHPNGTSVPVRINEYTLRPPSEESGAEEISFGFAGDFE